MSRYEDLQRELQSKPRVWLVTGVAGFIGSNLLEALLKLNQAVVGLDNFSTGYEGNLDEIRGQVSVDQWKRFRFVEGDIRDYLTCVAAVEGIDFVLHQAALGSVPRSIEDPIATNQSNVDGFLNMLVASRDAGVEKFVYAASSSTYGDHKDLPKRENIIGEPLSPYAITKYVNELYANNFAKVYGLKSIGLRYFNVFGKRQDPNGAYAAVIPRWINSLISGDTIFVNGDGSTSRDFCYVENAVEANILAACSSGLLRDQVYNVAMGARTSLNELYKLIYDSLGDNVSKTSEPPVYRDFREGDVLHSEACIEKIVSQLGYSSRFDLTTGIEKTVPWYLGRC